MDKSLTCVSVPTAKRVREIVRDWMRTTESAMFSPTRMRLHSWRQRQPEWLILLVNSVVAMAAPTQEGGGQVSGR